LGQTVEEAAIVKWHKQEGDAVKKGDVLFEIETDKAVLEAESFYEGTLLKILVEAGQTVPVSSTVAYVGKKGESVPKEAPAAPTPPASAPGPEPSKGETAAVPPAPAAPVAPTPAPSPAPQPTPAVPAAQAPARLFISPRAKAVAKARTIDPSRIRGSGPNGRIVVKDMEAYLAERGYDSLRITPAAKRLAARENVDILDVRGSGRSGRIMVNDIERAIAEKPRKLSKRRQVIARRLTESFTTTPHFYVTVCVDMTDLLVLRRGLKARGTDYKVTDFILEAVILSLEDCPPLNSVTDGEKVRWHGQVDLGMAVGVEDGLVVPVIRDAESLGMDELHETAQALAAKARDGKLLPDEMSGSTFTVSNMGMMDVDSFHAIINPGESAILAVASTNEQPVVINGKVKVRSIMKMTLSADHRIVDGTSGAGFINAVKAKLEDMQLWKSLT